MMNAYAIVTESRTGNTAQLAQRLAAILPKDNCFYAGPPSAEALAAPVIWVGFWTDKGQADARTLSFLQTLYGKTVYLFGTAGFGTSEAYFEQIIQRTISALPADNTVAGAFMCQGKMAPSVRARYVEKLAKQPENAQIIELIANFDQALNHPDAADLERFEHWAKALLE